MATNREMTVRRVGEGRETAFCADVVVEYRSSALVLADGVRNVDDVWTSVGVIAGVALVSLSGWQWLDPVIALLVAANIVWPGYHLMSRSAAGLMDSSLLADKIERIKLLLATYRAQGLDFHALRMRQAGGRAFMTLHVLVPGGGGVQYAHDWAETIERDISEALPFLHITIHVEPIEDPASMSHQLTGT